MDDTPPTYLHPHETANAPVTLHEGPVALRRGTKEMRGHGKLVFRFVPATGLRLEADITSGEIHDAGERFNAEIAGGSTEVLINSVQHTSGEQGHSVSVEASVSRFETGTPAELLSVGFQVVNFEDFLTPGPRLTPAYGFPPMVADLRARGWRVQLTAVEKSTDIFRSLKETGGYAFTHVGLLERSDGSSFANDPADDFLNVLAAFLTFARGAACGVPIRWGVAPDGTVAWQAWGSAVVDAWKTPDNWFDEHHGNLLAELFPSFVDALGHAELAQPLRLALHWYQKSNMRAGGMEGAIILGVTNLDLLSALVVVERANLMDGDKFDHLGAPKKLRMLLETIKAPLAIPAQFAELAAFGTSNNWKDGPAALANIRHGYVHANRKNRKVVLAASNVATFQAWQLAIWYQELALLHFLNHRGEYRNRVTAEWRGIVENVPWI